MREYQTSDCCGADLKLTEEGEAECTECGRLDSEAEYKDFDPMQADRVPRMEAYSHETSQIHDILQKERGDQRIGQFLINSIRIERKQQVKELEANGMEWEKAVERILWNLEAPELLETLEQHAGRL